MKGLMSLKKGCTIQGTKIEKETCNQLPSIWMAISLGHLLLITNPRPNLSG